MRILYWNHAITCERAAKAPQNRSLVNGRANGAPGKAHDGGTSPWGRQAPNLPFHMSIAESSNAAIMCELCIGSPDARCESATFNGINVPKGVIE